MRSVTTKTIILRMIEACGLFALTRRLTASQPRILMYHNFSADSSEPGAVTTATLRKQFEYLRKNFRVVSLQEFVEQLLRRGHFDARMVVITVDDGRRNCYEFCYPILKEFGFPATFYVVSSFVKGEDWIWTDKVLWLSEQAGTPGQLLGDPLENLFSALNLLPPAARDRRICAFATELGVTIPSKASPRYQPCSWAELREMVDSGLVEIGSHTVSHPILSTLNGSQSWDELKNSKDEIEHTLGKQVRSFCFPNGRPADYKSIQVEQVKDAGYNNAVVTRFGLVSTLEKQYELPRIGVSGYTDEITFRKYVDGAEHYQQRLRRSALPTALPGLQIHDQK